MNEWVLKTCQPSLPLLGTIPYVECSPPSLNLQPYLALLISSAAVCSLTFHFSEKMDVVKQELLQPAAPNPEATSVGGHPPSSPRRASLHTALVLIPSAPSGKINHPSHAGAQPLPSVPLRPLLLLAVVPQWLLLKSPPSSPHLPHPPLCPGLPHSALMASLRLTLQLPPLPPL